MPTEIKSFAASEITHYRIRDLSNKIAQVVMKYHESEGSLTKITDDMSVHSDNLRIAQNREQGNELSGDIRASEGNRDQLIKGFFRGVEFNLNHFSEERRNHAATLQEILDARDSRIHDEPDAVETLMLEELVSDLAAPHAVEALTALDMVEFPTLIDTENKRFVDLSNQRAEIESGKDIPTIRATRVLLHQSLRTMKEYLTLLNRVTPAKYETTVNEINKHITDVMALSKSSDSDAEETIIEE